MSETWPSILPAPSVNFNTDGQSAVIKTKMDSGRTRRRRRFSRENRNYKAMWQMTEYQFGMFQSWFAYKISGGADAFYISLPTGGDGLKQVLASFSDGKFAASHKDVLHWDVSAVLEVEDSLVWTEDVYDSLLLIGDIDALEAAVAHVEEFVES
jgi:hypothetical protein